MLNLDYALLTIANIHPILYHSVFFLVMAEMGVFKKLLSNFGR